MAAKQQAVEILGPAFLHGKSLRNGRCVKEPGLLKADWGRPKLWWEWLEGPYLGASSKKVLLERLKWISMIWDFSGLVRIPNVGRISWKLSTWHIRQDPLDWKSGLASAAKSAAGDFMGQFWDDEKWLDRGNIQDRNDCDECCQTLKLITQKINLGQSSPIISNPRKACSGHWGVHSLSSWTIHFPNTGLRMVKQVTWSSIFETGWNLPSGGPTVGWLEQHRGYDLEQQQASAWPRRGTYRRCLTKYSEMFSLVKLMRSDVKREKERHGCWIFFCRCMCFWQSFRPAVWCIIARCFMMLKETKLMRKSTQTGTKKNG